MNANPAQFHRQNTETPLSLKIHDRPVRHVPQLAVHMPAVPSLAHRFQPLDIAPGLKNKNDQRATKLTGLFSNCSCLGGT